MANVTLEHVSKRFGQAEVVRDLSIDVVDREFLVLVGPSGCGKSTILRMIAGLEDASSGSISIGARLVNDVPPKDRDIAMVFQNYALYPHMNVHDNMAFGLRLRHTPKPEIERRVKQTAQMLGIDHLLGRKPKQLSGGQRQRVALGRAIVREPLVFLMDEPLSNLDAKLRVQTRAELIKLHQRLQTTVVYVTHDQVEAMTMGSRIAVLNNGELQQLASPAQIYSHPANVFVAGFIGSPGMNFLNARLIRAAGGIEVQAAGLTLRLPPALAAKAMSAPGADVILGIRPEDVRKSEADRNNAEPQAQARVEVVEHMGSELFVYLRLAEDTLTARLDPSLEVAPGDTLPVSVNPERVHLFDPQTERTLL